MWGRSLGEQLASKHGITNETIWTPKLLATYLNDVQAYFSNTDSSMIFTPFSEKDERIIEMSNDLNKINE